VGTQLSTNDGSAAVAPDGDRRREFEDFLYAEADLLDGWQIEEWLRLFTDDCSYWIPSNSDEMDPRSETALVYDDHNALEDRVLRLLMPSAHSQWPRSRVRRIIGNVRVLGDHGESVKVSSNFIVQEIRVGRQRTYAGRYEHVLRREGVTWRIKEKRVFLLANDEHLNNLTFIL
jgi:3-phenylpropionate/cinnamic acid dioxygenase small subunit